MTKQKSYIFPLSIIAVIFFVFGFIIWLNGVLIPYFKICLELTNFQASLVVFAAYIAYFVMALPSAGILKFTGYKKGMVLGLSVMAIGALMFIPAAYTRTYGLFLSGLFITGTGLTLLQASVNPYVAIIGPIESTAQRVGFLGFANKVAGIFSIFVLGSVFLLDADSIIATIAQVDAAEKAKILDLYALKIVGPYLMIASVFLSLAALIFFSNLPEIDDSVAEEDGISKKDTLAIRCIQISLAYPGCSQHVLCNFRRNYTCRRDNYLQQITWFLDRGIKAFSYLYPYCNDIWLSGHHNSDSQVFITKQGFAAGISMGNNIFCRFIFQ